MAPKRTLRPTELPLKTEQTAHRDFFYDVPYIPEGGNGYKFLTLPTAYLSARIEYAVKRLRERVEVSMQKHRTSRREVVLANIDDLHLRLMTILDEMPSEITNQRQFEIFCQRVRNSLQTFKSDRERITDVAQKVSEIIFQMERDIIRVLFELPPQPDSVAENIVIDQQELKNIKEEIEMIIALRPQIDVLLRERIFEGWPLVKELHAAQKWPELRELFAHTYEEDLKLCRISRACIGDEDAPYKTKEEMFQDVFPEVFPFSAH